MGNYFTFRISFSFLSAYFFLKFLQNLFPQDIDLRFFKVLEWLCIGMVIFTTLTPSYIFTSAVKYYLMFVIIFLLYALYIIFRAYFNKRVGSSYALTSIFCLFTAVFTYIFEYFSPIEISNTFQFFCFYFFFLFPIVNSIVSFFDNITTSRQCRRIRSIGKITIFGNHESRNPNTNEWRNRNDQFAYRYQING
ncbi:MAG: hypothetical protein HC803_07420 [Saprospiraceae bacterium]|nr:hypothetical protein [Saprospiraceae bacterium]